MMNKFTRRVLAFSLGSLFIVIFFGAPRLGKFFDMNLHPDKYQRVFTDINPFLGIPDNQLTPQQKRGLYEVQQKQRRQDQADVRSRAWLYLLIGKED